MLYIELKKISICESISTTNCEFVWNKRRFMFDEERMNENEFVNITLLASLDIVILVVASDDLARFLRKVTFMNDIFDSIVFVNSLKSHAFLSLDIYDDITIELSRSKKNLDITSFTLDMTLWCEIKRIIRLDYSSLWEILRLENNFNVAQLSRKLLTLLERERKKLSILDLLKITISIKANKQLSRTFDKKVVMYYFDVRILVTMLLNFDIFTNVDSHQDIIEIVNNSMKLWHSNCWNSNIRICDSDCVFYLDFTSIIFLNFILYEENNTQCMNRVIFFDRDCKHHFFFYNKIVLRVQFVIQMLLEKNYELEYVLIEDKIVDILSFMIFERLKSLIIERNFE